MRVLLPRLFSVYGAGLKKQLLWDLCGKIASGGPIVLGGGGDELRDWIEVRDVSRILVRLGEYASEDAPVFNVASGIATSVAAIVEGVLSCWNIGDGRGRLSFSGLARPGDPKSLVANVGRLGSLGIGGVVPVTAGIAEYVSWYRAQAATI